MRRANARREWVPARRLRIETALGLRVCFNLRFHLPVWDRRMHHTPIRRSAPARTKRVETVTRTAASSSFATDCQSIVCHAVEASSFLGSWNGSVCQTVPVSTP